MVSSLTAAHELGHYVYHRDRIGDGIYDDAAYRSGDLTDLTDARSRANHKRNRQ